MAETCLFQSTKGKQQNQKLTVINGKFSNTKSKLKTKSETIFLFNCQEEITYLTQEVTISVKVSTCENCIENYKKNTIKKIHWE